MVQRIIYADNTVQELLGKLEKLGCSIKKDEYGTDYASKGHIEIQVRQTDSWLDSVHYQNGGSSNTRMTLSDTHREGSEETQAFCKEGKELYLRLTQGLQRRTINSTTGRTLPVIHAVSLNSAVDIRNGNKYAGGKGLNVARALTNLGVHEVYAYTFTGGNNGKELRRLIEEAGVFYEAVEIADETRITNILQGSPEIKQSTQSPEVTEQELMQLIKKLGDNISENDFVVLTGSLPRNIDPRIYAELIRDCNMLCARVILDATGEPLKYGLLREPYVVKPNLHEWRTIAGGEDIKGLLSSVVFEYRVPYAMAMNGREGMIFASQDTLLQAIPPEIIVKSAVGSGDAATAGFIYSQIQGWTDQETARFAVACGTASAEKEGTELCTLEDALKMKDRIRVIQPE